MRTVRQKVELQRHGVCGPTACRYVLRGMVEGLCGNQTQPGSVAALVRSSVIDPGLINGIKGSKQIKLLIWSHQVHSTCHIIVSRVEACQPQKKTNKQKKQAILVAIAT